jgi:hypothetical protein
MFCLIVSVALKALLIENVQMEAFFLDAETKPLGDFI